MNTRTWCLAIAAALAIAGTSLPAHADLQISGGTGGLMLWNGEIGHASIERVLTSVFSNRLRIGGGLEVAKYKTDVMGVQEVGVNTYNGRAIMQVLFFPTTVSPYVGVGAGLNVVQHGAPPPHSAPSRKDPTVRVGVGGMGFAGVHMPVGQHLSLFSEARAGMAFDSSRDYERGQGADRLGGFSGMAGLTLEF